MRATRGPFKWNFFLLPVKMMIIVEVYFALWNKYVLSFNKFVFSRNLFVFSKNVFVFLCENETIHYEAVEWGYGGRWPIMLAHFNKMNTLLLFYRKMGNTLFLEQDEYIFIVFRNEERHFIFLTARWALSYHFIYIFYILIYNLYSRRFQRCARHLMDLQSPLWEQLPLIRHFPKQQKNIGNKSKKANPSQFP